MLTYKSKPLRVPTSSLSFFRITWFAEFFSLLLRMSEGREGSSQRPKVGKARAHSLLSLLPSGLHSCHGFSEALGLLIAGPLSLCQPTHPQLGPDALVHDLGRHQVRRIVRRGGRPFLRREHLPSLKACSVGLSSSSTSLAATFARHACRALRSPPRTHFSKKHFQKSRPRDEREVRGRRVKPQRKPAERWVGGERDGAGGL